MLGASWDSLRLTLHVLAATVWVGGQLTLAALVPALRRVAPAATRVAARRYNEVAWPAFGVLVATGAWNVAAERDKVHGAYASTLLVKLLLVVASGVTAFLHARSGGPRGLAVFGALTAVTAVAAVFYGVLLAG